MKLLELCLSDGFGGLELYAEKVIRHYFNKGTPIVSVVSKGSLLDKRLQEENIPRIYAKVINQYFPIFAALKLAKMCRENNITTIHIHWRKDFPLAVFTKIFCGLPVRLVYTRQMALTREKRDLYHRFLYQHLDYYLTITENLRKEALRFLPLRPDLIRVLYYGVPAQSQVDSNVCEQYFNKFELKDDIFTAGMFGRIEPGKGQHLLIDATLTLIDKGVKIQSAIIGHIMDQSYFDDLNKKVNESGHADKICFAGFHSNPTSVMSCFDVIVLASQAETFGLVLPEAMRAGTAVIGTNAGGVPEIIQDGETGLMFTPGSSDEMAACLQRLIDEPAFRRDLAVNGKIFADQNFSEEKHFASLDQYLIDSSK